MQIGDFGVPIFGGKGVHFFGFCNYPQKLTLYRNFCGAKDAARKFFAKNTLKRSKNAILGNFVKWTTSNFRKSISYPIPGHPLKSSPDPYVSKKSRPSLFWVKLPTYPVHKASKIITLSPAKNAISKFSPKRIVTTDTLVKSATITLLNRFFFHSPYI